MKVIIRWIIFTLCLFMALVATLPAPLIVHWFPVVGLDTRHAALTGPWWNARMQYGVWWGKPITDLTLRWQPTLSQWLNWQVAWQAPMSTGQTNVTWPLQDGQLFLRQTVINIDIAQLPLPNIEMFGVFGIDGHVQLSAAAMSVNLTPAQQPQNLHEWVQQIDLTQPINVAVQPLFMAVKNNYGGVVNAQALGFGEATMSHLNANNGYQINVDFSQSPTLINGTLTFVDGVLASNVALRLTKMTPDVLAQLLPLVAKDNGQSNYSVTGEWRL